MKKIFLSVMISLFVAASSFAAGTNNTSNKVASNFAVDFSGAHDVTWKTTENYVKAGFILNGKNMEAFYDHAGNLIASSFGIALDELPTNAKRTFAKRFEGYTVKEAVQFEQADEVSYYLSAENNTQKVVLKVSSNGDVSTFETTRK